MRCVQLCAPGTALPCNMLELEATCLGACEGVCLCLSLCEHSYFTASPVRLYCVPYCVHGWGHNRAAGARVLTPIPLNKVLSVKYSLNQNKGVHATPPHLQTCSRARAVRRASAARGIPRGRR